MTHHSKLPIYVLDSNSETRKQLGNLTAKLGTTVRMFASQDELFRDESVLRFGCLIASAGEAGFNLESLLHELEQRGQFYTVVCTIPSGDVEVANRLIRSGAFGVVTGPNQSSELRRLVVDALSFAYQQELNVISSDQLVGRFSKFSQRDREVFALILEGRTNKEIAAILDISLRTVEHRRCRIYEKTGTNSLPELVRLAMQARFGIAHDDLVEWTRSSEFPLRLGDRRSDDALKSVDLHRKENLSKPNEMPLANAKKRRV